MLLRLFIVELWANASNCRHGVITLTFDLWRHRVCRLCGPSYSVPVPSSGLIRLFGKIVANFPVFFRPCHSHSFCKAEYHGHKEDNACYSVAVLLAENRNERIFSNIRESCYWKTAMKLLVNCYRMWQCYTLYASLGITEVFSFSTSFFVKSIFHKFRKAILVPYLYVLPYCCALCLYFEEWAAGEKTKSDTWLANRLQLTRWNGK